MYLNIISWIYDGFKQQVFYAKSVIFSLPQSSRVEGSGTYNHHWPMRLQNTLHRSLKQIEQWMDTASGEVRGIVDTPVEALWFSHVNKNYKPSAHIVTIQDQLLFNKC